MVSNVIYEKIHTEYKSPLKVVEVNLSADQTQTRIDKHWHRSLEFIVPINNATEVWIEGESYHVFPKEMVLTNSRNIHECGCVYPGNPYHGYAVQLKYDFMSEVVPNIDSYQFNNQYDYENHPHMFKLIEKIIKVYKYPSKYQYLRLQSLAYELLYELVAHYSVEIEDQKAIQHSKNKARLVEILSYLDKNASEVFDAAQVAEHFHLSYGHLAKLFKTELGMTMKEYVNSVRIRNATFDLLATELSIIDIAMQHGFVSAKAFYKEFEKVYHMTPKQYRKTAKEKQTS